MLFHFPRVLREKCRKIERMKEIMNERSIEKIKKINRNDESEKRIISFFFHWIIS